MAPARLYPQFPISYAKAQYSRSRLRIFHIFPDHHSPKSDTVLRSFQCPNKIIEDHYNLHQLLKLEVVGYPYPISKVLVAAPVLQELIVTDKVFMDKQALQGISSGKLGRCLTSLGFVGNFNVRRLLDMVASRQRRVKQVVEASRSWEDQQISGIKRIFVLNDAMENCALAKEFDGKADELEELDVNVYHPCEGLDSGFEELAWPGNHFGLSWQNVCDFPRPSDSNCKPSPAPIIQPAAGNSSTIEPSPTPRSPTPPPTVRSFKRRGLGGRYQ